MYFRMHVPTYRCIQYVPCMLARVHTYIYVRVYEFVCVYDVSVCAF